MKLRCGDHDLSDASKIYVMGVLNVTPDSFSDGGSFSQTNAAVDHAQRLLDEGADILDIGGIATSPHVKDHPSESEELSRVLPVIEALVKRGIRNISVDTFRARIAHEALLAGASWINDQSAAQYDPVMASVMCKADGVVLMHNQGGPTGVDAGEKCHYDGIIDYLLAFFRDRITALVAEGVARERIIIDPGIGFGKGLNDSLTIINNMHRFGDVAAHHLIGLSRKSFLQPLTGIKDPRDRDHASAGAHAAAILSGARIIRTHNVRACVDMARVFTQCLAQKKEVAGENLH